MPEQLFMLKIMLELFLWFLVSRKFKFAEKTAIEMFNEFLKCGSSGYIYSLCQDKGCGFYEIKRL